MSFSTSFLLAVLALGLGTYALRSVFLLFAGRLPTPPWASEVLRVMPPAVLAAIIVPALLLPDGVFELVVPRVGAAVVAVVVAWRTHNVLATLAAGLGAAILLQALS